MTGSAVGFWIGHPEFGFRASEDWFLRQLQHAHVIRGMDQMHELEVSLFNAELVMDACILYVSEQCYVDDRRYVQGKWKVTDTPADSLVSMCNNCKDSARAGIHIMTWLQWTEFTNPIVVSAQIIARAFAPLLCFGGAKRFGTTDTSRLESHVYVLCIPLSRAVDMLDMKKTSKVDWFHAAMSNSQSMDVMVLEGTTRFSPNIRGGVQTKWTREAEKSLGRDWTTLRNSFESLSSTFYVVTTSCTAPIFKRLGLCDSKHVRFLFRVTPNTIGVLTSEVTRAKLVPMPNMDLDRPDMVFNMRRNERVTEMLVSHLPHPAAVVVPGYTKIQGTRFWGKEGVKVSQILDSLHRGDFVPIYSRIVDLGPAMGEAIASTGCRAYWPEKCANASVVAVCIR